MKNKELKFGAEAQAELFEGLTKVYKAVSSTLGPSGKNVIIEDEYGRPFTTKDGVTVAKAIKLKNPIENQAAQILKNAAQSTNDVAGDGTSTSTVLAYNIINNGLKHINSGANRTELRNGIKKATDFIVEELVSMSKPISNDLEIEQIGTISANNDNKIGKLISTAMSKVGRDGVVTVEKSKSSENSIEIVEGMRFNNGYISPYFITHNERMQAEYENPYILLYDGKITAIKSLIPILELCRTKDKALVIIADDIQGEALGTLVVNKAQGNIKSVAIKAPEFGDRRKEALEDIAVLTGATVISSDKGITLDKTTVEMLGTCRRFTCNSAKSTIIDGTGTEEAIGERLKYIQTKIENADSDYEKEQLQQRLARLAGGVAILNIGAETELEMEEMIYRVEDALNATKAAVEEGIVTGGGIALMNIANKTNKSKYPKLINDEQFGFDVVMKAIQAPFNFIIENSGYNPYEIYSKIKSKTHGFDITNNKIVDFYKAGIIDPTLVVKTALLKSSSVASQFLITDCVIVNEIEEPKKEVDQMMY